MPITTKEIAEMVGVSRQAVSAVLNGHPEKVCAEKRRKIFHIAKNMQYRPNTAALKLSGHDKKRFVVIDSGLTPAIKLSVLENMTEIFAENGIGVRVAPPGDKASKIRALYDGIADGACAVFTDLKPELFDVDNFPVPLVIMGNASEKCDISFDYEGAVPLITFGKWEEVSPGMLRIFRENEWEFFCKVDASAAYEISDELIDDDILFDEPVRRILFTFKEKSVSFEISTKFILEK